MMTAGEIAANEFVTFGDVKLLAGAGGPCITIVTHIPNPFELHTRLKNAVARVEKQLKDMRMESMVIESLLTPIRELTRTVETVGLWSNALILFRSPGVFRYFLLRRQAPEMESVEERFRIRPLLSALTREQRFHLLGLSRQHIRLFRCTPHREEKVSIQAGIPRDMRVWLNTRQPDHLTENRSSGGPSVGSMKGVLFGTNTDREREDEYLSHFFEDVDKGVNALLQHDPTRLLLAGVEYEVAIYRRVSAYPRLFGNAVPGSPDGLPDHELHRRAMDVVMQEPSEILEKALADFERFRDTTRVTSDATEVMKAASQGRVADLLFREDATLAEPRDPGSDLLDAAALETVQHYGQAFALEGKDMPIQRELVALLRF
jgi:hypothetical protein